MKTSMKKPRALVVGCAPNSLGSGIYTQLDWVGFDTFSAGISGEFYKMDATMAASVRLLLEMAEPFDVVVSTIGLNQETDLRDDDWVSDVRNDMDVNFIAPLNVLQEWLRSWGDKEPDRQQRHFVVVSSNSAHVARSASLGYCASKAALSMATRCAGRALARTGSSDAQPPAVWAVEPGWINGTPMSDRVIERLGQDIAPHRIPGGNGMNPTRIARFIAQNIIFGGYEVNGCTFRWDGGEQ